MTYIHPSQRVKLTTDLTTYRSGLVVGTKGWTCPNESAQWGVMVKYDNGSRLDTLWGSLEVITDETKKEARRMAMIDIEYAVRIFYMEGGTKAQLQKAIDKIPKPQGEPKKTAD